MICRPTEGVATDASHSTKNRLTRYRGIDLRTGTEVFHESLGNQTVNVGEFLSVVAAAKYILEQKYFPRVVYTDSLTAIAWFMQKQTASKRKLPAIFKAEIFLQTMAVEVASIQVVHWDNRKWGETPADYGLK